MILGLGVWLPLSQPPPLLRQLQFSPEEVLGMVLNYSRSLAEDFAGEYQDGARGREPPKICSDSRAGALLFLGDNWTVPEDTFECHRLELLAFSEERAGKASQHLVVYAIGPSQRIPCLRASHTESGNAGVRLAVVAILLFCAPQNNPLKMQSSPCQPFSTRPSAEPCCRLPGWPASRCCSSSTTTRPLPSATASSAGKISTPLHR